jgi:hypothetical protein
VRLDAARQDAVENAKVARPGAERRGALVPAYRGASEDVDPESSVSQQPEELTQLRLDVALPPPAARAWELVSPVAERPQAAAALPALPARRRQDDPQQQPVAAQALPEELAAAQLPVSAQAAPTEQSDEEPRLDAQQREQQAMGPRPHPQALRDAERLPVWEHPEA